jgi:hypothetical protein
MMTMRLNLTLQTIIESNKKSLIQVHTKYKVTFEKTLDAYTDMQQE